MRMMLRFTLPVEKGNQAFKDGSLGKTLESIMNKLKAEAAYFGPSDGKRGGIIFLISPKRRRLSRLPNRSFQVSMQQSKSCQS
jgi:hypothetical protein